MRTLYAIAACWVLSAPVLAEDAKPVAPTEQALSLVVMDPLAEPLSCPCVQGYAQRKYEKLAEYLSEKLGRPVNVTFAESFEKALAKEGCKTIDIAIGKDSVVRHDAKAAKLKVTPLACLTGQDGKTTQNGMIVVRSGDPAQHLDELQGYRILFGPQECDEKFAAARQALVGAGVEVPAVEAAEMSQACSDGACKIIEWGDTQHAAAVISSYAAPLLEGCGTIKKGDLRVVGETAPVPFITAFATNRLEPDVRKKLRQALLDVGTKPELKEALETLMGFVEIDDDYRALRKSIKAGTETEKAAGAPADKTQKTGAAEATAQPPDEKATSAWPGWRGPTRDGRVSSLPKTLPTEAAIVWRQPLQRPGLGGIAATERFVIIGDRDISNAADDFHCYSAIDGELLWSIQYPAPGELDYDNMPRATPLIDSGFVYLLGAFGHLTCADLETGVTLWRTNVIEQFAGDPDLVWGTCSSPLIVDGKLIINPGGPDASLVALDPLTGKVIWQSPGDRHAYGSFIVATLGGVRQLVGYDRSSLGGWEIATGRRLWTLKPPHQGDFNVPTPVATDGRLLVTTENNFARLYEFDREGKILPRPAAVNEDLAAEISTPIVVGNRAFCVNEHMFCLDLANGLRPIWIGDDKAFGDYAPLIASGDRILTVGLGGELLLIDAAANEFQVVSRFKPFTDPKSSQSQLLGYPALVNTRLYLRGENELVCVELMPQNKSITD
jgi:ABC-type phosphate/phosphonate transport system substrate-binding protein/outer membrane protein assembly factor BamB